MPELSIRVTSRIKNNVTRESALRDGVSALVANPKISFERNGQHQIGNSHQWTQGLASYVDTSLSLKGI